MYSVLCKWWMKVQHDYVLWSDWLSWRSWTSSCLIVLFKWIIQCVQIHWFKYTIVLCFCSCGWHCVEWKEYMLFAGWEVRIVKNCDRGLENAARGRGHSFSLYGPTLSRQITYLFFPAINWLTSGFTQLCHWIGRLRTIVQIKSNERTSD